MDEIDGGKQESSSLTDPKYKGRGGSSKATVLAGGIEQELMLSSYNNPVFCTSGVGEVQEENWRSLPNKVVGTDSKGWSYEQPKSEERCLETGLCAEGDARESGEFVEERLTRMGLGNHGDEASKKSVGGVGDSIKAGAEENQAQTVSRSILDECVQMVFEERSLLLQKDGFKEIFDADDDEVQERRNENIKERVKAGQSPRSSWELLRPSSTPRLAAWLLKAGASEAQVHNYLNWIHHCLDGCHP